MSFLAPGVLLLSFLLGGAIILLYMLKLRRRDVLVSSTFLWQRLLRDREANAPWQRLRRNLLLLLQLLIVALLTFALARPFVPVPAVVSGSVVLLLDASASMQATDVLPTRFEAARRAALEIVDGLGAGDVATIIAVGPQPELLASASGDRATLRQALEAAKPSIGRADWEAAFALASASLAGMANPRAVIISDGAFATTLPSLPGEVRFVEIGGDGGNLAITALATREGPVGPQAFLQLVNYGEDDVPALVELIADGVLFDARRVVLPAGKGVGLTFTDLPYDLQVLQAQVRPEEEEGAQEAHINALSLDDAAWATHQLSSSGKVLLISAGNLFLERALGALPGIELVRLDPGQPLPTEPPLLTVFDGPVTTTLPVGNLWLIGPDRLDPPWGDGVRRGVFTDTTITTVLDDDPLLRYVNLDEVHVLYAQALEPPPDARVLVAAAGGPLLFVAERPEGRLAVLTFDLRASDLPLQIAFPILTVNLMDWLLPHRGQDLPRSVSPGDPVPIRPAPNATRIVVYTPDGSAYPLPIEGRLPVFPWTDHLGVYWIKQQQESGEEAAPPMTFVVNLFDAQESDIRPRDVIRVGQEVVSAEARTEEGRREFWPWVALVALGVLGIEWWAYQRGI